VLELLTVLSELLAVDVTARHVPGRAGDIRHSHAAIDAAVRELGYRPTVTLRDGLAETLAWTRTASRTVGSAP
jgi:nucleoside-diphosphate-sugar epimerase